MWAHINFANGSARPAGSRLQERFHQFLRKVTDRSAQHFAEWRQRREQLAELQRLDDRDLADLGISRADFPAIVKGTYKRDEDSFEQAEASPLPLTYVREVDNAEPRTRKPQPDAFTMVFWPFAAQSSWFDRYWYGEN